MQPLAPTSRRASQQRPDRDSALVASHPYATAPSQTNYRNTQYGRSSPVPQNGTGTTAAAPNTSDSYVYGNGNGNGVTNGKSGYGEGSGPTGVNGVRAMNIYEQAPMGRAGEQDEHGDGQKRGFWAALCCRT